MTRQSDTLLTRLVTLLGRLAPDVGSYPSPIPGLALFRREKTREACACLYRPGIVMVCQGAKQMMIDGKTFRYDSSHMLAVALDLPASSQIIEATLETPCLGLSLDLERSMLIETASQLPPLHHEKTASSSVATGEVTPPFLEALLRLLSLVDEPVLLPVLAPLIKKELYCRLLMQDVAPVLWQIASTGSASASIRNAIDWLKENYAQPLRIAHLAERVHMSPSSLHHHFRRLTGRSPLHYQKWLRLSEARRLMINENLDAAAASYQVGYESPSHFSRDYKASFGLPPKQDTGKLHRHP
ncbi:AraC family transcriptional regulator [Acetobacteraceae bacterium ESL0709]|nr:AraC family transcriptional regulator [Acetobacteraceae bacterium ESL0697]MDF7677794.1 AraC family transcriptional regulator [Acetobacteraceae bacterium ESL0709]